MRSSYLEQNSGKFFQEKPTVISKGISVAATNTTTQAVSIPLGAYVTKVALMCTVRAGSVDVDVGDGDNADRYADGITAMTANDILNLPNVASGTDATNEVGGRYYAAADTIDVVENTTGSANVGVGSVKVLVWYYV